MRASIAVESGKTWRRLLRLGTTPSIRTRLLAIVLIPSAALLITGTSVAGYLISQGVSARNFSDYLGQAIDPLVSFESVVQQERTVSLRALGGDQAALANLQAQRNQTNLVLSQITGLAAVVQNLNPDAVSKSNAAFAELGAKMPVIRQGVDTRGVNAADVDGFYTKLAGVVITGLEGSARTTPDPGTAAEEITATDLFWVTDLHSRAAGIAAGAAARGVLSQPDRQNVTQLAGGYRNQLNALTSRLTDTERARYDRLVSSPAWQNATSVEDNLAARGTLSMPAGDWLAAEDQVSSELLGLWGDHFRYAENLAVDAANTTLTQSIVVGSLVLALAIAVFIIAVRMTNAVVRRLQRLRSDTLELATEKMPVLVKRIADGEQVVDIEAEIAMRDHGVDEIGQVADAFETAKRTAFAAAAAEARTRGGFNKVFLDIAHRSQLVVHRQLEVLDVAEAKQSDPEHLELLFQLDHLATHARRNAENLVILGGGQPGRKWRRPVPLEDIVRSAISETEHFARVSAVRLPNVELLGGVVADLIHLLAELVDNATNFSPPDAPVSVRGNLVGKGVVVEVEDQGLGLVLEERERLNETLRNPPDFQEMALSGQRHLGLFVIGQLAQRHGISVSLLESAYGGIKAVVLIPTTVIDTEPEPEQKDTTTRENPESSASFLPRPARDPIPRMPVKEQNEPRHWPTEDTGTPWSPFEDTSPPHQIPVVEAKPAPSRKRAPLPRRQRQAHLAPQLQLDNQAAEKGGGRRLRSPDEARSSMSSFQRGSRQGRSSGKHTR
ncbi:sensor histidine kinase [Amycolatopsis pithecellobii]|uniref:sensor histidine kinase n=1 Tax=Amycolatopsis pithecellobii TaxID=664692 RepID=UPI00140C3CF9|nr:nitrate- and nitrite sensing domain-containing protein [Amycolatopsis pithecellobii]